MEWKTFTKAQSLHWTIAKLTDTIDYLYKDILSDAADLGNNLFDVCKFSDNKEIKKSIIEVITDLRDKAQNEFNSL